MLQHQLSALSLPTLPLIQDRIILESRSDSDRQLTHG